MITRILAPIDGCDRSENVLPYVEELSQRLEAHITVLHVFPPSLHLQQDVHSQYVTGLVDDIRKRLSRPEIEVKGIVLEGKPSREIVDFAAQADIGLIAAAPHSQTSITHWTVGRTADKVIRETSKPVLLVRNGAADRSQDHILLSRVLVPLDGSRASRDVLPYVESILKPLQESGRGRLFLLHVLPGTHYATGPAIAKKVDYTSSEMEGLHAQASRYLEEIAVMLRRSGKQVESRIAVGDAATMILKTATETETNLIAMTTHGYTGFSRLFLGSVADRVLRNSTVPLLLIKPSGH
ncbi:MAG: universal stress protein [Dehalococcoidia bacterium]|nr:universal stress protein [Dehalococcoidia bacterium]